MGEVHFTFINLTDWPLWPRVKLAVALVLTPLTLVFLGRSITVTFEEPEEKRGCKGL